MFYKFFNSSAPGEKNQLYVEHAEDADNCNNTNDFALKTTFKVCVSGIILKNILCRFKLLSKYLYIFVIFASGTGILPSISGPSKSDTILSTVYHYYHNFTLN